MGNNTSHNNRTKGTKVKQPNVILGVGESIIPRSSFKSGDGQIYVMKIKGFMNKKRINKLVKLIKVKRTYTRSYLSSTLKGDNL